MGKIGQALAKRARSFDMVIHYHNRRRLPAEEEFGAVYHESLDSLLAVSDVLSLNAPSTPETQSVLNAASIDAPAARRHRGEHRARRSRGR